MSEFDIQELQEAQPLSNVIVPKHAVVKLAPARYQAYLGEVELGFFGSAAKAYTAVDGAKALLVHLQKRASIPFLGKPPKMSTPATVYSVTSPDSPVRGIRRQAHKWYVTSPKPCPTKGFDSLEEAQKARQELLAQRKALPHS